MMSNDASSEGSLIKRNNESNSVGYLKLTELEVFLCK